MVTTGVIVTIILVVVLVFSNATFLTIEPGHQGVLFRRFGVGLDKEHIYYPGFHVLAPWNIMYVYDMREQQLEEQMEVLSRNGLTINVDITVRVNPKYDKIGSLHEKFGIEYVNSLVRSEVRSAVRKIIGRYDPEELYSSKREEVQQQIQKDLEAALVNNYVELRATLIRGIQLPEKVRLAIEDKIESEQQALKYEYILQQERKEAERKIIEAKEKGYRVTLLFFWLQNFELAKERVKIRVSEGGHNIEPEIIERRYIRGIKNLFDIYLPIVDGALIFDNSEGKHDLIAEKIAKEINES